MSKQDTAGGREYIACNGASETWNNWESWKWQKVNRGCGCRHLWILRYV